MDAESDSQTRLGMNDWENVKPIKELLHLEKGLIKFKSSLSLSLSFCVVSMQERNVKSLNTTRSKRGSSRVSMRWRLSTNLVLHLELRLRSASTFLLNFL